MKRDGGVYLHIWYLEYFQPNTLELYGTFTELKSTGEGIIQEQTFLNLKDFNRTSEHKYYFSSTEPGNSKCVK